MTVTFTPGNVQWLGLKKETSYGVAQPTPDTWIPLDSPKWDPKVTALTDKALRGYMGATYQLAQGMRYDELSYKTMVYPDNVFVHLLAALGTADSPVTIGASTLTLGTTATTGGTLAAGATYWKVTATATGGEGIGSNEVTATLTGSTSSQPLSWSAVANATGYNVYRGTAAGAENVLVAKLGNVTSYTDTGLSVGAGTPPTTAANLHKTSLLNSGNGQPASFTGFLFEGDKCVQIPGMVIADLKFTLKADTQSAMDVTWQGMPGVFITAPVNTPGTTAPLPPFTTSITVGGLPAGKYSDISIDIKRGTKPIPVMNGTQSPLAIYCGELSVTGTIGAVYAGTTDSDLTNLLTNAQPAVVVSAYPQNDPAHPLTLQLSKVGYTASTPAGSNSGWMTISSNFEALMNTTDALDGKMSPIQAILCNTTATAY